jgi:predicted small metal-binding protein
MKQMTCAQMGGPCEAVITGSTADEMIANGTTHLTAAHPQMLEDMKNMPKEAMDKWTADFHTKWEATPEMPSAPPTAAPMV